MDVVRAGQPGPSSDRVEETATFDERRGHGQAEEREPGDGHEIDSGEVAEESRQADREEGHEAGRQSDEHVPTAADRPDQRNRGGVRRGKDERPEEEVEHCPHRALQFGVRHAEERRPDAERQRGPEACAVELHRLRDELPDGTGLGWQRRRQWRTRHAFESSADQGTRLCP